MSGVAVERPCDAGTAWPPGAGLLSLLRVALPLVVSRAGLAAMIVADSWMVARYDAGQLAINSLAGGTFNRLTEVFATAVMSGLPLVAAVAAGRSGLRLAYWQRATLIALVLGLVGLVISAWAGPILGTVIRDPQLVRGTAEIVWILGLGLPAGLVALGSAMYLEGLGRAPLVAMGVLFANGLNIGLNWLLIEGHAGFPAWGAYGSALGTTLVRIALAVALVVTIWRMEGNGLFAVRRHERTGSGDQWRMAAGVAGTIAGFHASAIWLTLFAGWLGPQALAAFASCWVLTMPAMLLAIGIGDAIGLRAARGGRPGQLWRDLSYLAAILLPFSLVLWGAPDGVTALYTMDPALRVMIAALLPIGAVVLFIDGLSYGFGAVLRARGDIFGSTSIQFGTLAATPLLGSLLTFRGGLGLEGLMLAILATSSLRLALLAHRTVRAVVPRIEEAR